MFVQRPQFFSFDFEKLYTTFLFHFSSCGICNMPFGFVVCCHHIELLSPIDLHDMS